MPPHGDRRPLRRYGRRCAPMRLPALSISAVITLTLPSMASSWRQTLLYQFSLVPQAYGEIVHQIDGIAALPLVVVLVGAPLNETGPAGERR